MYVSMFACVHVLYVCMYEVPPYTLLPSLSCSTLNPHLNATAITHPHHPYYHLQAPYPSSLPTPTCPQPHFHPIPIFLPYALPLELTLSTTTNPTLSTLTHYPPIPTPLPCTTSSANSLLQPKAPYPYPTSVSSSATSAPYNSPPLTLTITQPPTPYPLPNLISLAPPPNPSTFHLIRYSSTLRPTFSSPAHSHLCSYPVPLHSIFFQL